MKQFISKHPTAIAVFGILAIAAVITYQTTWNSKSWLIDSIADNDSKTDSTALEAKTKPELRKILRAGM